jgi:hypothetical protein
VDCFSPEGMADTETYFTDDTQTHVQGRETVIKKFPETRSEKKRSPSQFVEFTRDVIDDKRRIGNKDSS